ncbi:MAG TPA: DUF6602 domain-containing protein [Candidatus Sulfotelmatobacter sp.]|nr:DUF6602 domain-containing protein [Candidatus Sulfotelmatobacter sp.]
MPNILDYHRSVTSELDAIKDRIRNLVTHWLTDGEWKEAALRTLLRGRLPAGTLVGRGFIVARDSSSTQIDLLVLKPEKPTLFRDGELAIVTPDVPRAIAEVKTKLEGMNAWYEVVNKLAMHGQFCKNVANNEPWLGIFVYEGSPSQTDNILDAMHRTYQETGIAINCVTCGYDVFVRYWPIGEYEPGDDPVADAKRQYWRAYNLNRLSPSYFTSNLVDAICNVDREETDYAWFAFPNGKRPHIIAEKQAGAKKRRRKR